MSTKSSAKNTSEGKNEAAMDYNLRQDGNYIVVGDRWRMELPYGVRCRLNTSNAPEHKGELLFELDRRILGSCFLDEALKKEQEADRSAFIMMSIGAPPEELINAYLRNDEIMSVQLVCRKKIFGETTFEIIITEKERAAETRIVLIVYVKLTEESIHNIQEHAFTLKHPFGSEWERYLKIAMRMASSISPLHETQCEITLGPAEIIEGGFSVRLPSELKRIKPKDGEKTAYLPTSNEPTQESFDNRSDYPYYALTQTGKIDTFKKKLEEATAPFERSSYGRILCDALGRSNYGVSNVVLWERVSAKGSKAVYLMPNGLSLIPYIFICTNDGNWAAFHFCTESGYDLGQILRIARAVFDNVHYPGDAEITPLAIPDPPQVCCEHMILTLSGSYTAQRDADFIGQPICTLMKKCGNNRKTAYKLMQIPNDNYTLDIEARRLAKVFRLDAGMFDPYTDAEAMIRMGMLSDVGMLHALRSLAWTVECKADREQRRLESYTFEELEGMSKFVKSRYDQPVTPVYLNYSTDSYCSGLCSHYDWRVFYVPDQYFDYDEGDYFSKVDLRELCRKENRSGSTMFMLIDGDDPVDHSSMMNQVNEIIARNEETLESLEALRKDLIDLLPVMRTIYDGLMKNRNRKKKLKGMLADALNAWCTLAVAAIEPFYSEEANRSTEAEVGLSTPMEPPKDDFENRISARTTGSVPEQSAERSSIPEVASFDAYRAAMEAACKSGKSLQNMIEDARKAVSAAKYADASAFELAIANLDKRASIVFPDKHFVLTGFGIYENAIAAEIEKRGGIIHSGMVRMADYLVVRLASPGAAKIRKALEWRQKGANNLIISDYQMWQTIFAETDSTGVKKALQTRKESDAAGLETPTRKYSWIGEILPEGFEQEETERELEGMSDEDAQTMIEALRGLKEIETQISEIDDMFNQAELTQEEDEEIMDEEIMDEEIESEDTEKQEREEAERSADEDRKLEQRKRIETEIQELTDEMNSLSGLFAALKRRKLKKKIDDLNEQLREI